MLPSILTQLGPDGLKRLANNVVASKMAAGSAAEDEVPDLVESFEATATKDIENLAKQTEEFTVS